MTESKTPDGQAWYITDWCELYEVNKDGRPWKQGETKRAKALDFVRWHVYGPSGNNNAYLDASDFVAEKFGEEAWAVAFAVFGKCLEIAAARAQNTRGYLLGKDNSPISARTLRRLSGFTNNQIELGLRILSDPGVRWLEKRPLRASAKTGRSRRNGHNETETEQNETELNETKGKPNKLADSLPPSSGSDSGQASDQAAPGHWPPTSDNGKLSVPLVAQRIALALNYNRHAKSNRQIEADRTCFQRIAGFVVRGDLGQDKEAVAKACYAKASEIATKEGNTMARYMAWFKKQLKRFGHTWEPSYLKQALKGARE